MNKLAYLMVTLGYVLGGAAVQQVEYIDPAGGYTQVVTVTDRGVKTIFVSGQVGQGADFTAHVASAFTGVTQRVVQAGATVNDVVKIRIFVRDLAPEMYDTVAQMRRETFPEGSWPASTVAGVQALARDQFRVEVEAIAVVAEPGVELQIERLAPSNGFSGTVAVTAHGVTTIHVSGQVGEGDGLGAQAASVWQRIGQRLEAAGAAYEDLVKTTTYIVDFDPEADMRAYRRSYPREISRSERKPASTLLGVPALASDQFLVEIDAIAVLGSDEAFEREFIGPERTYTQVVTARSAGPKTIYLAGQVGQPGDSLAEQAEQVYANLAQRLAEVGASPSDLLNVTVYIPGFSEADLAVLGPARQKHGFLNGTAPASTLLGIQSLYSTEARIEIEGVAVVHQ